MIHHSHTETMMSEYGVVTAPGTVRLERTLPGPVERVWSHLIDSQKRGTWLATGEIEPRVGGRVEHVWRNNALTPDDDPPPSKYADIAEVARMEGRVTAYDPPRLLSYTWGGDPGERDSEVTFELSARGDEVLLVLTHRRLTTRDAMLGVSAGWHAHLEVLAARLAGRTPPGFWRTHNRLETEYASRIPAGAEREAAGR